MCVSKRLLSIACLLGIGCALTADDAKTDKTPFEGMWVVESATVGDLKIEVMGKDKKAINTFSWVFVGNTYKFVNEGVTLEEGTFRIDPDKSPKHLDLIPKKGEILTTQKCLYSLDSDELKIAETVSFAPGTPEAELEEAKKMRASRPTSFGKAKDDAPLVFVLKRKKP